MKGNDNMEYVDNFIQNSLEDQTEERRDLGDALLEMVWEMGDEMKFYFVYPMSGLDQELRSRDNMIEVISTSKIWASDICYVWDLSSVETLGKKETDNFLIANIVDILNDYTEFKTNQK